MSEVPRTPHWRFRNKDPELLPPPGPLAEELDLTLSTNALRHYMTFHQPEGFFNSAWHHVEYAMNKQLITTPDIRKKYIGDAYWLIGEVLRNKKSSADTKLGALTLATFMPVLTKRALNEPINQQDCSEIYKGLGSAMRYISGNSLMSWRIAETMLLAAAARTGQPELLMFPTSPREERSQRQAENHDGYFLKNDTKVRIQQKMLPTEKHYSDDICIVEFLPIVTNALQRSGYSDYDDPYDAFDYVLSAMLAETCSEHVEPHEQTLLNYLSRSIAARQRYTTVAV